MSDARICQRCGVVPPHTPLAKFCAPCRKAREKQRKAERDAGYRAELRAIREKVARS